MASRIFAVLKIKGLLLGLLIPTDTSVGVLFQATHEQPKFNYIFYI